MLKSSVCSVELDIFDRRMLEVLSREGRITVTDLAVRIGLSKTPCQVRLKRLVDTGVITGFRAVMDSSKIGADQAK